jgi:hypothetical protein
VRSHGCHIVAFAYVARSDDFVTAAGFLPGTQLAAAAAGSSKERADEFAQRHGFQRAYGTYLELAQDKDIDIVYVGNVHPQHRVRSAAQHPRYRCDRASVSQVQLLTAFPCTVGTYENMQAALKRASPSALAYCRTQC